MKKNYFVQLFMALTLMVAVVACSKDDNGATGDNGGGAGAGSGALVTGKKVSRIVQSEVTTRWENGIVISRDSSFAHEITFFWNVDQLEKLTMTDRHGAEAFLIPTYEDGHVRRALMRTIDSNDENAVDTIVFRYDKQGRMSEFSRTSLAHGSNSETGEYFEWRTRIYGYTYDEEGYPHRYSLRNDGSRYDWGYTWTGGNLTAYDEYGYEFDNKVNYWRCALPWELLLFWGEEELSQNNVARSFRIRSNGEHTNIIDYNYQYSGNYPVSYSCMRENEVYDGNGRQVMEYVYIEYTDGTGRLN